MQLSQYIYYNKWECGSVILWKRPLDCYSEAEHDVDDADDDISLKGFRKICPLTKKSSTT